MVTTRSMSNKREAETTPAVVRPKKRVRMMEPPSLKAEDNIKIPLEKLLEAVAPGKPNESWFSTSFHGHVYKHYVSPLLDFAPDQNAAVSLVRLIRNCHHGNGTIKIVTLPQQRVEKCHFCQKMKTVSKQVELTWKKNDGTLGSFLATSGKNCAEKFVKVKQFYEAMDYHLKKFEEEVKDLNKDLARTISELIKDYLF